MDCFGKRFNRQQDWASPAIAATMCWPEVLQCGMFRPSAEQDGALDHARWLNRCIQAGVWHREGDEMVDGNGRRVQVDKWYRLNID